ncbi:hypothetical protein SDC9_155690 [bioreactor metagenome]|uniref:Uncharacterized protein n=1 Tax=bioreactor metagenome TaxID=1076179 RepID=A0A645F259_9ZZZZ
MDDVIVRGAPQHQTENLKKLLIHIVHHQLQVMAGGKPLLLGHVGGHVLINAEAHDGGKQDRYGKAEDEHAELDAVKHSLHS